MRRFINVKTALILVLFVCVCVIELPFFFSNLVCSLNWCFFSMFFFFYRDILYVSRICWNKKRKKERDRRKKSKEVERKNFLFGTIIYKLAYSWDKLTNQLIQLSPCHSMTNVLRTTKGWHFKAIKCIWKLALFEFISIWYLRHWGFEMCCLYDC